MTSEPITIMLQFTLIYKLTKNLLLKHLTLVAILYINRNLFGLDALDFGSEYFF